VNIYPTNSSIQKTVDGINDITRIGSENRSSPETVIHQMNVLVNTWLNYYHHTEYAEGLERIQSYFKERLQVYMNSYTA